MKKAIGYCTFPEVLPDGSFGKHECGRLHPCEIHSAMPLVTVSRSDWRTSEGAGQTATDLEGRKLMLFQNVLTERPYWARVEIRTEAWRRRELARLKGERR